MMKFRGILVILSLFLIFHPGYSIVINEIVASNSSTNSDKDGDYSDWIELYNESPDPVNVNGFHLSDDPDSLRKWTLPDITIPAKGFLLIWCSGKDLSQPQPHSNFKLDRDGEYVVLSQPAGDIADSLTFPPLLTDFSYGRFPDGSNELVVFGKPTPVAPNQSASQDVFTAAPVFSKSAGFYSEPFDLKLTTPTSGADIFYTLDGSEPGDRSTRYTGEIRLFSTSIVRAVALKQDMNFSSTSSRTFFVNMDVALTDLPVLSLITDPLNLWDPKIGIYANATLGGQEWERPVSIDFFEGEGEFGFSTDAGIRIHGGASRLPWKSDKKSFRLYFRSEYGLNRLNYPIIPSTDNTDFDRLVLRAGFNDAWIHWLDLERELTTYVRDQLMRDVCLDMGYPASHGDFAHLYLNGEYWGLYNISERYDDDFCDTYIEEVDWDIVKPGPDSVGNAIEASEGDLEAWNTFYNWYRRRDLSDPSDYQTVKTWVDIDNFIDFYLLNIFAQNYDWPRHNWYAARKRENGRWIFLPWDSEYAFGSGSSGYSHSIDMWDAIDNQAGYALPLLYSRLRNNQEFREDVAARLTELMTTHLSVQNLEHLLNTRVDQIRMAVPFEAERWGNVRPPDVYDAEDWQDAVDSMTNFIQNRGAVITGQMVNKGFIKAETNLPEGWRAIDIGGVQVNGYAAFDNGTITLVGSGADIWSDEDEFIYLWMRIPGDLDIKARVVSLTNTDVWAKAGVMIRETPGDNSKNALVALTPDLVTFQSRADIGEATTSIKAENLSSPHWVRLTRNDETFTAYESEDGKSWNRIAEATISMRASVMAGLAVTSHNDGVLCTAVFDNLTVNDSAVYTANRVANPDNFEFLHNYPNPFNPVTTIEYVLPSTQNVELAVYDIQGRLVSTLIRDARSAGRYTVRFDGMNLPSGVYYAKIKAGPYSATRKMLLLK